MSYSEKQEERETLMQASHQKQNTCPHELTQGLYSTSKQIGHFQSSAISAESSMSNERQASKAMAMDGVVTKECSRSGLVPELC